MLGTTQYDINKVLVDMNVEDINKVQAVAQKWKGMLCKDSAIKAISEVVGQFQRVQDWI